MFFTPYPYKNKSLTKPYSGGGLNVFSASIANPAYTKDHQAILGSLFFVSFRVFRGQIQLTNITISNGKKTHIYIQYAVKIFLFPYPYALPTRFARWELSWYKTHYASK